MRAVLGSLRALNGIQMGTESTGASTIIIKENKRRTGCPCCWLGAELFDTHPANIVENWTLMGRTAIVCTALHGMQ